MKKILVIGAMASAALCSASAMAATVSVDHNFDDKSTTLSSSNVNLTGNLDLDVEHTLKDKGEAGETVVGFDYKANDKLSLGAEAAMESGKTTYLVDGSYTILTNGEAQPFSLSADAEIGFASGAEAATAFGVDGGYKANDKLSFGAGATVYGGAGEGTDAYVSTTYLPMTDVSVTAEYGQNLHDTKGKYLEVSTTYNVTSKVYVKPSVERDISENNTIVSLEAGYNF